VCHTARCKHIRKVVKVKQINACRQILLAGRDTCPLPSSVMNYPKWMSSSGHNSVRLATSQLWKCESEGVSRRPKRGTKARVDFFRLSDIEFNLHIVSPNKTECDVNIWQHAPHRKMTSQKVTCFKRVKSVSRRNTLSSNLAETGFEKVYNSVYMESG